MRRDRTSSLALSLFFMLYAVAVPAAPLVQSPGLSAPATDADLPNEDTPEPFVPLDSRDPVEEDRVEALSLFSSGRMLEQQGDLATALRRYQRALRLDPSALSVLNEIVQLAFGVGRSDEAIRYALKAARLNPMDPVLLERLGLHLTSEGQFAEALELYQSAAKLISAERSPARVLLAAEMGELHQVLDEPAKAADEFAIVVAALEDPDAYQLDQRMRARLLGDEPGATYQQIAEVMLDADRIDEAEKLFEKADQHGPDPGLFALHQAQIAAKRGQTDAALAKLQECFDDHESEAGTEPFELLVELEKKRGQEGTIDVKLEALHAADPENGALTYFLAQRMMEAQRFDKAQKLLEQMLADKPTAEGLEALVETDRRMQQWPALVKVLGVCVAEGGDLSVLEDASETLVADAAAIDALIQVGRAAPPDGQPGLTRDERLGLALLVLEAKRLPEAAEFFRSVLAEKPEDAAVIYLRWGFGLLAEDAYAEAVDVFREAIEAKVAPPEAPDFKYHLAGALEMLGQTDAAIEAAKAAEEAAETKPDEIGERLFRIYPRRAWILYHAKRMPEAKAAYEEVLKRLDTVYTSSEARESVREARFALSNLCVLEGDLQTAEEWLEQVLDEYPDDVAASNDLGYLWADAAKNLHRALPMVEAAVNAQPENAAYRDSLGWILYRMKRGSDAVRELEKAVELSDEPDGVILEHLGDAYLLAGKPDEAKATWQKSLTTFDEHQQTEERDRVAAKLAAPAIEATKTE